MNTTDPVDLEALRGFTKGPWTTSNVENSLGSVDSPDGSIRVAQAMEVSISDRLSGHLVRKANARLIAAAPSMHAELTARRARDADVEALVARWRRYANDVTEEDATDEAVAGALNGCADELAALTGANP